MAGFPHYRQHDMMDCGPTCLQMVSRHYGKQINIDRIRKLSDIGKTGVSLLGISRAAEAIGIRAQGGKPVLRILPANRFSLVLSIGGGIILWWFIR